MSSDRKPRFPERGIWLELYPNSCAGILNLSPEDEAQKLSTCPPNGKSVSAHSASPGL